MIRSTTASSFRRAFTLVELLVVIGIIALLISILLPTLASARAAARSTLCLSNQKQVMQSVLLYTNENETRLPYAWAPSGDLVNRTIRLSLDQDDPNGGIAETYRCPSAVVEVKDGFFSTAAVNLGSFVFSPPYVDPPRNTMKITSVPRSSEVIAFADANQTKADGTGRPTGGSEEFLFFTDFAVEAPDGLVYQPQFNEDILPDEPLPLVNNIDEIGRPGAIRYRHSQPKDIDSGATTVAFHDGHAELRKAGTLTQKNIAVTY